MLDRKFILQNIELVRENCVRRRSFVNVDIYVEKEKHRLELEQKVQAVRTEMNALSKNASGANSEIRESARKLKEEEKNLKNDLNTIEQEAVSLLKLIPNLTHPDTPTGDDEAASVEVFKSSRPIPKFDFPTLDHKDLGEALGMLDMNSGTKVAKPGFYFLSGDLAMLEIALMRFAVDRVVAAGYKPYITPQLANDHTMEGTGYVPRGDESNTFVIENEGLNLIATSEITLCGMHADTIIDAPQLPIRSAGISHCFRTERAAGRATRGLYRVHQFQKVEMVAICEPKDGEAIHKEMLAIEKGIFDDLELPYRVLDIASGDLGAPAYRKYDIEAWMPHRGDHGTFGEVTSTSNCTDYQARRLNIRYRDAKGHTAYAYTLNGTGLAIGRGMIAILENKQNADRSVTIPEKLRPYFGKDLIAPPK